MLFCCEIYGCYHGILETVLFILRHLVMENSLKARVIMNVVPCSFTYVTAGQNIVTTRVENL